MPSSFVCASDRRHLVVRIRTKSPRRTTLVLSAAATRKLRRLVDVFCALHVGALLVTLLFIVALLVSVGVLVHQLYVYVALFPFVYRRRLFAFAYANAASSVFAADDTREIAMPRFVVDESEAAADAVAKILLAVISNADDREQRDLVRVTWARRERRRSTTSLKFIVGTSLRNVCRLRLSTEAKNCAQRLQQLDLAAEQRTHQDLMLTTIDENYYNLSLKTLVVLTYAASRRSPPDCIIKADSDNFLHVANLEALCDSLRGASIIAPPI